MSMTGSAQFTPVSVSLASPLAISTANPNVVISVLDLKVNKLNKYLILCFLSVSQVYAYSSLHIISYFVRSHKRLKMYEFK